MDQLTAFIAEHWVAIVGIIVAAIAAGLTIHFTSNRQSGRSNYADQRGAKAGGDIVGRDKTTNGKD